MEIDRLISGFRHEDTGVRWVKAANLHLTLRFLGDIPLESVTGLAAAIRENLADFSPFELTLSGLGGFPNLKRPRVIWVGTGDGTDRLNLLAARVEGSCIEAGFGKSDKPFSSHMTIGRVRFPQGPDRLIQRIEQTDYNSETIDISEVSIFKSDLSPAGPKYTRLEAVIF